LQEAKEVFMSGIETTRTSVRIMSAMLAETKVNTVRLLSGFTPDVYATDRALELVASGMPFRDAYHHVKANLQELENCDPHQAISKKQHLGATAGLDFSIYSKRIAAAREFIENERKLTSGCYRKLMGN